MHTKSDPYCETTNYINIEIGAGSGSNSDAAW